MRGIAYGAAIITDSKLGMMVLLVGDLCDDINKCHGLVIIFKFKITFNGTASASSSNQGMPILSLQRTTCLLNASIDLTIRFSRV